MVRVIHGLLVMLLAGASACAAEGLPSDSRPGTGDYERPADPDGSPDPGAEMPADPGGSPDPGGMPPVESDVCRHLDIVFSVDPSGSMTEELVFIRDEIFPELARTLQGIDYIEDFRVGVMDSCWDPASFHTRGRSGECGFSSGEPWMDSTSPDLVGEFACVGDLHGERDPGYSEVSACTGQDSDNEHPATAAMYALEAARAGTDNPDFLRDDAVLVVFALTDEDEQPQAGPGPLSADEIFHRIVAVKGNPRAVAFLGVGGATDCDGVYGQADEAILLKQTTARFAEYDRGLFWNLCGGNLHEGLTRVVELIERACNELTRPCDEFMPGADWTECYGDPGTDPGSPPSEDPPLI